MKCIFLFGIQQETAIQWKIDDQIDYISVREVEQRKSIYNICLVFAVLYCPMQISHFQWIYFRLSRLNCVCSFQN